jgi:hypothetical protein
MRYAMWPTSPRSKPPASIRARAEQVAPQGYVALAEVIAGRAGIGDSGFGIRDSKE